MKTLEALYGDVLVSGKSRSPGYLPGVEAFDSSGRSGWNGWIIGDGGALGQSPRMTLSALRYMLFPKAMPDYEFSQFDFERDTPQVENVARMMSALDPDLSRFQARGGKLLMYFGWADPALNPRLGIEYYESVAQAMGTEKSREFFRLFMLPGVFHCSGGVGPACFDVLQQIIPWVEQGRAPESIVATQLEGGKTLRSRPLCVYPAVARYKGNGSTDQAENFRCVDPRDN